MCIRDRIQGWATIEDDGEVIEALRQDAVDEMTALLAGTHVSIGGEEEDEQQQGSGDENTGRERRAPPAYDELSSHIVSWKRQQRKVATETRRST